MNNIFTKTILITLATVLMCACANKEVRPAIVPGVEIKREEPKKVEPIKTKTHKLGVIGAVEPIYFLPMKTPFNARIDTGAETSAVDVDNLEYFERDGEKWVSFDLINRLNNETHHFEKKIYRNQKVKRSDGREERLVVLMQVKFGGEIINTQFSLSDRDKFKYQGLVGRNIITGRAIVDTAISNTLK
jgi:hypothetical protein